MQYLAKRYNFISLNRLVTAIEKKDWSKIPSKALVVTIDDGHMGNFRLLESIKKYQVHPTIYLCSHIIGTNRHFWWKSGYQNIKEMKSLPHRDMLQKLRTQADYWPEKEYDSRQALNISEINAMQSFVDFQSHSKFHPVLINCPDNVSLDEIKGSKSKLEKILNQSVTHFSYPNGDYSQREIDFLKKCGYKSYLEIGTKADATFSRIEIENKIGLEPRAKNGEKNIISKTSDDYFKDLDGNVKFDIKVNPSF